MVANKGKNDKTKVGATVDMPGAKKTKARNAYTYEQFLDDYLKIEMSKDVSGNNIDKDIILTFVGYTGMSIAERMAKHIKHANNTSGLANIRVYILDSDDTPHSNYATKMKKGSLPEHTFVKVGGDDIRGYGKKVTPQLTELTKEWFKNYLEDSGRIPTEFIVPKKERNFIHVLVGSMGSGTGGNGLAAITDVYESYNVPYILLGVINTIDGESANNATRVLEPLTNLAKTVETYETVVDGKHILAHRPPVIVNVHNNYSPETGEDLDKTDIAIMTNILAYTFIMGSAMDNIDISDIENFLLGFGTPRQGLCESKVIFGYLTEEDIEGQVTAFYVTAPRPSPEESPTKNVGRTGLSKGAWVNEYPLTVPMTISLRLIPGDKVTEIRKEIEEGQKALASAVGSMQEVEKLNVNKPIDPFAIQ